jgi:hypothetical protein
MTIPQYLELFPNFIFVSEKQRHINSVFASANNSMRKYKTGIGNPNYGKKQPTQSIKIANIWHDKNSKYHSKETKDKHSFYFSNGNNPLDNPITRIKRDKIIKEKYQSGEIVIWNKNLTEETDKRVKQYSNTRRLLMADGKILIPHGSGYGTKIILSIADKKILLRSTYELVVAIYYNLRNWNINYEDTRVNYNGHNYLSDFRFGNNIYEVKGYIDTRANLSRYAFINAGFNHIFILKDTIIKMKKYITKHGIFIDNIIKEAKYEKKNKRIYCYKLETKSPTTLIKNNSDEA